MDFIFEANVSGKQIKRLKIVNDCSREAVDILVDCGIEVHYVTKRLSEFVSFLARPFTINSDQGVLTRDALDK